MSRIQCMACSIASIKDMHWCRECGGLGYIERLERVKDCNKGSRCKIVGEFMTGGWMCNDCGDSGPA